MAKLASILWQIVKIWWAPPTIFVLLATGDLGWLGYGLGIYTGLRLRNHYTKTEGYSHATWPELVLNGVIVFGFVVVHFGAPTWWNIDPVDHIGPGAYMYIVTSVMFSLPGILAAWLEKMRKGNGATAKPATP